MKRILLVAVSSSALALAAPGMAAAHHHHHAKHHSKHHKRHAARARVLTFRATSAPATTPATTPATPSTESAGKVASFKEGVLTITLNDGTPVSGKVTEKTEIHCPSTTAPPTNDGDADDVGGSGADEHGTSHDGQFAHSSSHMAHAASGGDDGQDGPDDQQQSCTTAALVEGALVREAELSIGPAGAVWDHVDLM
jgi:hypothetical protein